MSVKWTKEQQSVVDLRDRSILVSAAAGSGKTAVLGGAHHHHAHQAGGSALRG